MSPVCRTAMPLAQDRPDCLARTGSNRCGAHAHDDLDGVAGTHGLALPQSMVTRTLQVLKRFHPSHLHAPFWSICEEYHICGGWSG
jgi:hypothetical protein